ncbi:MAG TPA: MBL fold metallo-hydrolase [Ottowia sp.]|uniref:MBL fold metallo-hydrolase n=1 Tax=Ottowia sp. TaxID=1898956 RepID=UPI002CF4B7F6|nr:MBL fold metallo-hydrolase [Ottowia sp.]HMN20972.1 MBL fold metallo-hydrolase [Ottowia sp.]
MKPLFSPSLRLDRMQSSPLWTGAGFRNRHPILKGLRDASASFPSLRDVLLPKGERLPPGPLPSCSPLDDWLRPASSGLRATWLGHSTVLIEIDGRRVLTDPVWGLRASPMRWAGPRRFQPVPVALDKLPPLDAVLISHDHYDHLDAFTIRRLARLQPEVPFVTALGVGARLEAWGVPSGRVFELDWWQGWQLPRGELAVHAAPSQHFSGRGLQDRNHTLWSSLVIESPRHRVFFSGDTGLTTEYGAIRARFGAFDLVLLEVGAFHPAWGDMHLGPRHALEALELLGGGAFLPVHWGTFALALHDWDQPVETLLTLPLPERAQLLLPRLGQAVEPAHGSAPEPWWRAAGRSAPEIPAVAGPGPAPHPATAQAPAASWPLD